MKNIVSFALYGCEHSAHISLELSITRCILSFEEVKVENWKHDILATTLQDVKHTLAYTSREVMTPLRHAVTGMKVSLLKLASLFMFDIKRTPRMGQV